MPYEAVLYRRETSGRVVCDLCRHRCVIGEGGSGRCRVRRNEGGKLVSIVYGRCIAIHADPIEKKPLFHFLPGTQSFSIATVGCNFTCRFCQNHEISQWLRDGTPSVPGETVDPSGVITRAERSGCRSIAFTYTEPTVYFEYALDTARLAHERGLATCFVSNGHMTREAIDMIAPVLDAINVDLKSFDSETYRSMIGGSLEGVLDSIGYLKAKGVWVEVTTLLVPGMNDSPREIREIARFIAGIDRDIPWHVSRFFPNYEMETRPPTDVRTIELALNVGHEEGLRHVYCGNLRDDRGESTWCVGCGGLLVARSGYRILDNHLHAGGKCPDCGTVCPGVWE
jgi:pyruvate formate lyase activating enzyme